MPQNMKQKAPKSRGKPFAQPSATITDPRFSNFQTDPRFRVPSRSHTKVKVDSRFAKVLDDEDFVRKAKVDKYGRKIDAGKGKRDMRKLYEVVDEEDDSEGDEDDEPEAGQDELELGEDDDVVRKELRRVGTGMSDGEEEEEEASDIEESSSESSSDSEDDSEEEEVEEMGLRVEEKEVPMGEVSSRLAVVNLDWDNIRAVDLMAVASSFVPQDGRILNVTVYPSEFGRERMQREEIEGPPRELFQKSKRKTVLARDVTAEDDDESDASEDADDEDKIKEKLLQNSNSEEYDSTALRRYQLDRLRYYYAVVTCSSPSVGKALYDAMDGREYLSSANFFDLRFVPDDVSFEEDKPRDECEKVPEGYRPAEFVTDALQHSKVRLTWDEDDHERKDIQKRAFGAKRGKKGKGKGDDGPGDDDLAAYIASDSSDEGSEGEEEQEEVDATAAANRFGIRITNEELNNAEKPKSKKDKAAALRAMLGLAGDAPSKPSRPKEDDKPVGNLQITFSAGLSAGPARESVFVNEPEETTMEKYIRKEKERKARRKEKSKASKPEAQGDTAIEEALEVDENNEVPGEEAADEDDPFNDPFFEDPVIANRNAAKKAKKAEKERLKREREAEEKANSKQRAELELLMADDDARDGTGKGVQHFDMNEIAKAEKDKKKKKKQKKAAALDEDVGKGEDGDRFQMQVDDPRFVRLFESHEFAIDPNDPRFKGTEGMKALLEEGRKRRKRKADAVEERGVGADLHKKSKKKQSHQGSEVKGEDVMKLVQKVKGRAPVT
ncbi:hypothetical protein NA57DRAFT_72103 [Rhizodiscina lignyota]|uniref:NUC153 domain-containing protein n=1 Tax=Rhizodiscina lignyota TaxID=1504668 RepID=A0A9P4MAC7_9PEZI|nr:hypothetical protein NA57DRAFT_72103 [Rhizodiscina lignyota]